MANHNHHGQELDGKGNIQPTPFDAHDRKVCAPHTYSREHGYQPAPAVAPEAPEQDGE